MKKQHDFKAVSDTLFCDCGKPLKLNLIERKTKPPVLKCFKHYMEEKRKRQNSQAGASSHRHIKQADGLTIVSIPNFKLRI